MALTTFSSPKEISDAWKANMALADGLLEAVASASGSSGDNEGVLEALEKTAQKMEIIYAAAIKRAEYEDNCCGFSYKSVLGFVGNALDAGIQVVTTSLLAKAVAATEKTSDSYVSASLIVASLLASRFKQKVEGRNIRLAEDLALLEDILPNFSHINHIRSQVKFYETTISPKSPKCEIRPLQYAAPKTPAFPGLVQAAISRLRGAHGPSVDRYVAKTFCCYARLDEENISELVKSFKQLKETMTSEEEVIKGIRERKERGAINIIVNQLDTQVKKMEKIFNDVDQIIKYHEMQEKRRANCSTKNVRLSVQFLIEIGALISVILDAVYADSDSSFRPAKISALSLYIINVVLSWMNTWIAKIHEKNAEIFQQVKRLKGQEVYMEHIAGMVKKQGRSTLKRPISLPPFLHMDRAPQIGEPGSQLQDRIRALYEQTRSNQSTSGRLNACDLYIRTAPLSKVSADLEAPTEHFGEEVLMESELRKGQDRRDRRRGLGKTVKEGEGASEHKGATSSDSDSDGGIEVEVEEHPLGSLGGPVVAV